MGDKRGFIVSENLPDLKKESAMTSPDVVLGFTNAAGFAMLQRAAAMVSESEAMIPAPYRKNVGKCAIALEMANRIGVHFLAVMQNLYDVHGHPAWSSQFMIAAFNATPGFSKIRYVFKGDEATDGWSCRAWANEIATGERLDGSWVSIGLAKAEGWYGKNGSKWKTMPQQMLMYRAAAWFVRAYAPELTMGLQTREEVQDTYEMEPTINGTYTAITDLNAKIFDQPTATGQPAPASAKTSNKPTKAEMDQRREDAKAAVLAAGLSLDLVEKDLNAYSPSWTTAQCERAHKLAERAMAQRETQPQDGPDEADYEMPGDEPMPGSTASFLAAEDAREANA